MYLLVSELVITEGFGVQATTIKVKMLLLKCCTLPKFHVIDGQNTHDLLQVTEVANAHDQIAFDAFHSFLMEA